MKKISLLFLTLFILGWISTPVLVAGVVYSAGTHPGTVSNAGAVTNGVSWTSTSAWALGVVPLATDDVVIVTGDLVFTGTTAITCVSLTVQTGAKLCQQIGMTGSGTFTLQSGSYWYGAYGSATKLPGGFTTYSIDAASNWIITSAASSTLINASPALYGNLTVYKGGSILAGATGLTSNLVGTNINIQGNLTIDDGSATSAVKGANNKSDASVIIHVGVSVYIKTGILSGVDALDATHTSCTCTYNIDGNVFVGDASTASGQAALAPVSAADGGYLRTGTFNITGNLSYINGAKFEAGTNATGTNASESANINLYGNLTTDGTVVTANNTAGHFTFSFVGAGGAQTMTLGVPLAFSPATLFTLNINKSAHDVTLGSAASITGTLNLAAGNLALSGNAFAVTTISGGSASSHIAFDAPGIGSVALNVPASTSPLLLPVGTGNNYTPLTLQYPVAPTAGVITLHKVTPDMNGSDISALNDAGYILTRRSNQYWLYNNTASGSSYTLSIDGSSDQTGIDTAPDLRVIHSADGITFDLVGTHSAGSGTMAVRTGIPDGTSGRFYLAGQSDGENPLPVELSSFTANSNGRTIQLNWTTKTEKNSDKFDIERSLVGNLNWAVVGSVKAAVLSNSPKNYSYSDTKLQSGKYQYRLKMIDNDGSFSYSNVEAAEVAVPKDFALSQNYPNPFNPSTKIDYQVPVEAKVIMEVYNIAGQKVLELVNQEQSAGYYTVDFGASKLSSGVYVYRLAASDKATGNNFSSIKKMMLLK